MLVYGQLGRAALENLSSNPTGPISGRVWWNTTDLKAYLDDGTNLYAFLRNDAKAVFGNNGTANNNIRFHRGANSVLQFVLGGDSTSEGTLSTSLAQLSFRSENYTTAGLPAAGNAGRIAWDTTIGALKVDTGAAWSLVDTGDSPKSYLVQNLGLATSVGSNALTISLKQADGTDATAGSPVKIGFRNATSATGEFNIVSHTSSLSLVVSSGSTLGTISGVTEYLYVYALNNSGAIELAVSGILFDEGSIVSTTAEGGAGSADSRYVIYSTTARSNVPIRLIGRIKITEATAGTWASNAIEISLIPFNTDVFIGASAGETNGQAINNGTTTTIVFNTVSYDSYGEYDSSTGIYTAKIAGKRRMSARTRTNSFSQTAGQNVTLSVLFNNSTTLKEHVHSLQGTGSFTIANNLDAEFNMDAGDNIRVQLRQDSGGNTALNGVASQNYLDISVTD